MIGMFPQDGSMVKLKVQIWILCTKPNRMKQHVRSCHIKTFELLDDSCFHGTKTPFVQRFQVL